MLVEVGGKRSDRMIRFGTALPGSGSGVAFPSAFHPCCSFLDHILSLLRQDVDVDVGHNSLHSDLVSVDIAHNLARQFGSGVLDSRGQKTINAS
jgi:hypothetical protein